MDDIIFLLIAIALSVFGAINQSKKKRLANSRNEEPSVARKPSIFDQFTEDSLFTDEPEYVPQPAPAPKPASAYEPIVKKMKPSMKREPIIQNVERIKKKKTVQLNDDLETETTFSSILKDFSLKKAVIYSEILDRKY